ncbi:hypothetical protein ASD65_11590 [Microbacterium sp. Root61]|uniref:glycosyltransferase n=1 Tax=Microbacterium sp. Root61 TaxID=1736570 RepID=UPI0007010B64|nr:glycosyltransferase [Microbacterium sp. Root61]KRA24996.1 hypothetical protein ASD65_11590 [Microbacterium sp. Root61]
MAIDHVLLTRFNLPTGGVEARIRAGESWLANRWALFEQYCAPSVARQTTSAFSWVIYFDPESPGWLTEAMVPYVDRGLFRPIFRAEVPADALLDDVRSVVGDPHGILLTTNLDNDDAIAPDFMARLQAAVECEDRQALYLVNGLVKGPDGVYLHHDPRNAFCSVAAPWITPSTSWDDWHMMLGKNMPVVEIGGAPGWLQVVHGENVSNRVRGRLVSPGEWSVAFPAMLDDLADPGSIRLLHDAVVLDPARRLRDLGRATLRRAAISMLGKDGMQSLKMRLRR